MTINTIHNVYRVESCILRCLRENSAYILLPGRGRHYFQGTDYRTGGIHFFKDYHPYQQDLRKEKAPALPGYLSIFMALTLTVMLSLCLVLIEGARQNTLRLEVECITDIGLNSVLAEYHREVFSRYNLLFIDSSYGSEYPSFYNTQARLSMYMEKNAAYSQELGALTESSLLEGIYMDLLKLQFPEVEITGVCLATDNGGLNFQKQAVQVMESELGIDALQTVIGWMKDTEQYGLQEGKLEQEIQKVEEQFAGLREKQELESDGWVSAEVENPASDILEVRNSGVLNWLLSGKGLSSKAIQEGQYLSARREKGSVNAGNLAVEGKLSLTERLMFQEYLICYSGNFLNIRENSVLDYQTEYLLFGKTSDVDNLVRTAAAIMGIRESANLLYLSTSETKQAAIKSAAAVLSAALLMPEAEPVFEGAILAGWSVLESIHDMRVLMNGGKVALLKDDTTWACSLEHLFDLDPGDSESSEKGLCYEDYLRVLLCFTDLETITYRFMDLMEMDIRLTMGNQYFRMDGCIDSLEVQVRATSDYGYEYDLKHAKSYR